MIQETTTHSPKQQPPQSQLKRSKTKILLKKSKKPEEKVDDDAVLQRLIKLEKKVDRMSKIDHTDVNENSMQANMMNEVKNQLPKFLPKVVSEVVQPRIETIVRDVLKMTPVTLYQPPSTYADSLTEYELKLKLCNMMQASRSFLDHEKHLILYNALINSTDVDETNVQGNKDTKKRRRDKHDPSVDADKDSKKRKRKDADTSSSKKAVDDEEMRQDDVVDDDEMVQDDDLADDEMPHNDDAPTQDPSKRFKQDEVVRPETPSLEWFKEPNENVAPEHPLFNEMGNAEKDPVTFDDLMGSTVDFTKFAKNRLKEDKLTKADLEGHHLNYLKEIDWVNLGDRCMYDLSKPLSLQGPPGRTKIPVDFFFNQDLEYLKTGNKDKKYVVSLTKLKASRYELKGIEEMIPKLWSLSKVGYDLNAAFVIHHWGPKRQLFNRERHARTSPHNVYSIMNILSVIRITVDKQFGYGYLKETVVRRANQKEYTFNKVDFKSLHLNDIEDMLLLHV
ncbi:hypothetical protein Tco_0294291 [Tanacetum coccineum]